MLANKLSGDPVLCYVSVRCSVIWYAVLRYAALCYSLRCSAFTMTDCAATVLCYV